MAAGYRQDYSYLDDPLADYFTPSNLQYKPLFPKSQEEEIPQPIIIPQDTGDDRETRPTYGTPTGPVFKEGDSYVYDNQQIPTQFEQDLAFSLSGFGKDLPELAQAFIPGISGIQKVGEFMMDNVLDAYDTQYDRLTPPVLQSNVINRDASIPANNLIPVTDELGNVRYVEKDSEEEKQKEEDAKLNSKKYDLLKELSKYDIDNFTLADISNPDITLNKLQDAYDRSGINLSQGLRQSDGNFYNPLENTLITGYDLDDVSDYMDRQDPLSGIDVDPYDRDEASDASDRESSSYSHADDTNTTFYKGGYVGPLGNRR